MHRKTSALQLPETSNGFQITCTLLLPVIVLIRVFDVKLSFYANRIKEIGKQMKDLQKYSILFQVFVRTSVRPAIKRSPSVVLWSHTVGRYTVTSSSSPTKRGGIRCMCVRTVDTPPWNRGNILFISRTIIHRAPCC